MRRELFVELVWERLNVKLMIGAPIDEVWQCRMILTIIPIYSGCLYLS